MIPLAPDIASGGIEELPAVDRIMQAAFDPDFGEAWSKAQCLATFTMPGYALRVARDGEAIVGFAILRWVADESELLLLAVDPARRGEGIGSALLTDWQTWIGARGVKRLLLEMRTDNPAMQLYLSHGFTVIGKRRDYYRGRNGHLRDAVTMQKQLTAS